MRHRTKLLGVLVFTVACLACGCGAGTAESNAHYSEEVLSAYEFRDAVLVEIESAKLTELRSSRSGPDLQFATYEAEVVGVHSERGIQGASAGSTLRFYSPNWTIDGPLLSDLSVDSKLFVLARPASPPGEAERVFGAPVVVDYAFLDDEDGVVLAVPRALPIDLEMASLLAESLAKLESAGRVDANLRDTGPRIGALLDAFNDPNSGVFELLLGVESPLGGGPADSEE